MRPIEPLPLHHSWPLLALAEHMAPAVLDATVAGDADGLADRGIGLWHCDLADDALRWSAGVHDIFGLPRGIIVSRERALAIYDPASREPMERLRAYAIRHRRGFTLDIDLIPPGRPRCAVRLVAAPVLGPCGEVIALRGVKQRLAADVGQSRPHPQIFVSL